MLTGNHLRGACSCHGTDDVVCGAQDNRDVVGGGTVPRVGSAAPGAAAAASALPPASPVRGAEGYRALQLLGSRLMAPQPISVASSSSSSSSSSSLAAASTTTVGWGGGRTSLTTAGDAEAWPALGGPPANAAAAPVTAGVLTVRRRAKRVEAVALAHPDPISAGTSKPVVGLTLTGLGRNSDDRSAVTAQDSRKSAGQSKDSSGVPSQAEPSPSSTASLAGNTGGGAVATAPTTPERVGNAGQGGMAPEHELLFRPVQMNDDRDGRHRCAWQCAVPCCSQDTQRTVGECVSAPRHRGAGEGVPRDDGVRC
jgi:hypothetical protein